MTKKILTVDDSKPIRMIIQRAFRDFDCQIVEAADGVEGLAIAKRERPDLILLDLTMPVMDGYEMLTRLKNSPEIASIPVLMLTAEAGKENVMRIAKLGVKGYVVKPFKDEAIIEKAVGILPLARKGGNVVNATEEIRLLFVDDKPVILEQIKKSLAETPWRVACVTEPSCVISQCNSLRPSAVALSLSLPEGSAFTLIEQLRSSLKGIPIIGICLASGSAEQQKARLLGVSAFISKPIVADNVKATVERVLNIDSTAKLFREESGYLVISLPVQVDSALIAKLAVNARPRIVIAIDSGASRVFIDMQAVLKPGIPVVELAISVMELCQELGIECIPIGSAAASEECAKFQESKDWRIFQSLEAYHNAHDQSLT